MNEINSNYNKNLFQLAWPIFADLLLRVLTGSVNILMISQISVLYVASMTVGNQIFGLSIVIFNFVGLGTCVSVAQLLGSREKRKLKRIIHCSFGINLIIGMLVLLTILFFNHQILDLMQIDKDIHNEACQYMTILSFSFVFEAVSICYASILRAYGYTKESMYSSLTANLVTICSNFILLFGFLGLPQMGLNGAAISTVIGRLSSIIVIHHLYRNRIGIKIYPEFLFKPNIYFIKKILKIGAPAAGENFAWNTQFMVATAFIASMGNYELATHTYYFQTVCMYLMLFAVSVGSATEIIVAYHIGAKNFDIVYERLLKSLKIGLAGSIVITSVMACGFTNIILSIFSNGSAEVLDLAAPLILLSIIMEPGRSFNVIVINALRAANDPNFPLLMAVISMWCIAVPLEYFLGIYMKMGLLGVWIAFTCDEWIRGISMYIRWKSRIWEKNSKKIFQREGSM